MNQNIYVFEFIPVSKINNIVSLSQFQFSNDWMWESSNLKISNGSKRDYANCWTVRAEVGANFFSLKVWNQFYNFHVLLSFLKLFRSSKSFPELFLKVPALSYDTGRDICGKSSFCLRMYLRLRRWRHMTFQSWELSSNTKLGMSTRFTYCDAIGCIGKNCLDEGKMSETKIINYIFVPRLSGFKRQENAKENSYAPRRL